MVELFPIEFSKSWRRPQLRRGRRRDSSPFASRHLSYRLGVEVRKDTGHGAAW